MQDAGKDAILREIEGVPRSSVFGSAALALGAQAELSMAWGDRDEGLRAFDRAVAEMRAVQFPGAEVTGIEPWTVLAQSALTAFVRYAATPEQRRRRDELSHDVLASLGLQLQASGAMDYPVCGMALAASGARLLTAETDPEVGVRLLALARAFGYSQTYPVMAWDGLRALADAAAPGRLDAVLEEYGDRRGRELRAEAQRVVALTSSG